MDLFVRQIFDLGEPGLQFRQLSTFPRSLQLHTYTAWVRVFLVGGMAPAAIETDLATCAGYRG